MSRIDELKPCPFCGNKSLLVADYPKPPTPHDYRNDWIRLFRLRESTKRNLPCPCGSGKKYKKCCMTAKENK